MHTGRLFVLPQGVLGDERAITTVAVCHDRCVYLEIRLVDDGEGESGGWKCEQSLSQGDKELTSTVERDHSEANYVFCRNHMFYVSCASSRQWSACTPLLHPLPAPKTVIDRCAGGELLRAELKH